MKFPYKSLYNFFSKPLHNETGQILVEYLLLMVIAIGCATLLTKKLVGRGDSDTGVIIKVWDGLLKNISNDMPDCENQTNLSTANCPQN